MAVDKCSRQPAGLFLKTISILFSVYFFLGVQKTKNKILFILKYNFFVREMQNIYFFSAKKRADGLLKNAGGDAKHDLKKYFVMPEIIKFLPITLSQHTDTIILRATPNVNLQLVPA